MISCVIIDDELSSRVLLKTLLRDIKDIHLLGEADSVRSGIKEIETHQPDLVFLDVKMPGGDGFDLLKLIRSRNFHVIFSTSFDSFAIQAIREQAIDYLVKPVQFEELVAAVEKVRQRLKSASINTSIDRIDESLRRINGGFNKAAVNTVNGVEFINNSDIIRCSSESNYTRIYLKNGTNILSAKTLKEYHHQLDKNVFYRVHKSHIVNINYVTKFLRSGYLLLEDNSTVEIAKKAKDNFLKRIMGNTE
jgi:two-component system LytT family response regulator